VVLTGRWCDVICFKSHAPFCSCGTCSLALRKGHGPWMFENRGLGKAFGQLMEEVTGDWRRLYTV
jgi:hypothetical protein